MTPYRLKIDRVKKERNKRKQNDDDRHYKYIEMKTITSKKNPFIAPNSDMKKIAIRFFIMCFRLMIFFVCVYEFNPKVFDIFLFILESPMLGCSNILRYDDSFRTFQMQVSILMKLCDLQKLIGNF